MQTRNVLSVVLLLVACYLSTADGKQKTVTDTVFEGATHVKDNVVDAAGHIKDAVVDTVSDGVKTGAKLASDGAKTGAKVASGAAKVAGENKDIQREARHGYVREQRETLNNRKRWNLFRRICF